MARQKTSKSSKSKSSTQTTAKTAKSTSQPAPGRGKAAQSTTFSKARGFVEANASMQTAGIALAGAGLLALVSTEAGRGLLRTATDAVVSLISQKAGDLADGAKKQARGAASQARI